jgi:predicted nucleic acid-binding protein
MTRVFLDTDVILDFLTDRKPFSSEAAVIFTLVDERKLRGYVSSLTFSNLYYLLRKYETHQKVISKLASLSNIIEIIKVDQDTIKNALESKFRDFEDSIQYYSALLSKKVDVIITRNTRDYKKASLPVMTPTEYLKTVSR